MRTTFRIAILTQAVSATLSAFAPAIDRRYYVTELANQRKFDVFNDGRNTYLESVPCLIVTGATADVEGKTSAASNSNVLTSRSQNTSPVQYMTHDLVELTAMKDNVDSKMTRSGSIFTTPATVTITLTDTPEVGEAADGIISNGVRSLSRMFRLRLQSIKVTSKSNGEAGGDVSAAVSKWDVLHEG